jgi:hypothetical protein
MGIILPSIFEGQRNPAWDTNAYPTIPMGGAGPPDGLTGWIPFKVTETGVNQYAGGASDCTGTPISTVDAGESAPEWFIENALSSKEGELLSSIQTAGQCVGPFKNFETNGADYYLTISDANILPPYLGYDPSGGGHQSGGGGSSVSAPSGATYDIRDLCENSQNYAGPSAQQNVNCADWRAIGAHFLPGTNGCGLTWTSMCTFDGSLVSDSLNGAASNDVTFLMHIGDGGADNCCEHPICVLSECAYNPCSTPSHFRPTVTASSPHCIGDEASSSVAVTQWQCENTCHTGTDDVEHCCQWDASRADPNAGDYDPCHCSQPELCESIPPTNAIPATWAQRTLTCGGNMQSSAEYTNPSNPTMREQCCLAEDPSQAGGSLSGNGGDGGSGALKGLFLTSDDAKIIFGQGDQACKLELKQRTGAQSGYYLSSSCGLNSLSSTPTATETTPALHVCNGGGVCDNISDEEQCTMSVTSGCSWGAPQ